MAELKGDADLYGASIEKYERATELKRDYADAFNNWGSALSRLAELKGDADLYGASFEKYERATELKRDDADAFNNWGNAVGGLAKLKDEPKYYAEAVIELKRLFELGGSEYNLACGYAMAGEKELALARLESVLKAKAITVEEVAKDEDWEGYWDDDDFKKLMEKYR